MEGKVSKQMWKAKVSGWRARRWKAKVSGWRWRWRARLVSTGGGPKLAGGGGGPRLAGGGGGGGQG